MTRRVWVGFVLLCVLQGAGLILDQFMPPLLSGLLRVGVHDAILACVFFVVSLLKSEAGNLPLRPLAGWGILLFAVPQILFAAARGHVDGFTELLVTLLVSVVVVVTAAQRRYSFGSDDNPLRLLAPALAGVGGAVLVLPFYLPASGVGRAWLAAMVISVMTAGVAAVRLHGILQGFSILRASAVLFGTVAVATLGFSWAGWSVTPVWDARAAGFELLRLLIVEAPILLMTVWLLREMKPERLAARPFAVVFVMIAESYVVERPSLGWTSAVGIVLIAAGAIGLLRADSREVL